MPKISIAAVLSLFIVIVALSDSILVWLGYETATSSTEDVVTILRTDIDARVTDTFVNEMSGYGQSVHLVAAMANGGLFDPSDLISSFNVMYPIFATVAPAFGVSFDLGIGSTFGTLYVLEYLNTTMWYNVIFYSNKTSVSCYAPPFVRPNMPPLTRGPNWVDGRVRPWYVQQVQNPTWPIRVASIYLGIQAGVLAPTMSVTSPVYAPNGTFIGVTFTSVLVQFVNVLIQTISSEVGPNTVAYVVESNGLMIATSVGDTANLVTAVQYYAYAMNASVVRESALAANFTVLTNQNISTTYQFAMTIDGAAKWVDVIPMRIYNIQWYFVLVLHQDDFLAAANATKVQLIIIAVVISFVALVLALCATAAILTPLRTLEREMACVAVMSLEEVDTSRGLSRLAEVGRMQVSFLKMVRNITEYRNYMPASILAQNDEDEEDKLSVALSASAIGSQRSSKSKSTRTSTAHSNETARHIMAQSAASMELRKKRITICVVNVRGFLQHMDSRDDTVIAGQHSQYVQCLLEAVSATRGTPDVFLGDRFIATWNTVRVLGTHRTAGCEALVSSAATLQSLLGPSGLSVSSALASGECRSGNMGCAGMKKYTYLGEPSAVVHILERLNRKYGTQRLVDSVVAEDAKNVYVVRKLDIVNVARLRSSRLHVFELCGSGAAREGCDEWMYELQQGNGGEVGGDAFTVAVDAYFQGNIAKAREAAGKLNAANDSAVNFLLTRLSVGPGECGECPTPEEILYM